MSPRIDDSIFGSIGFSKFMSDHWQKGPFVLQEPDPPWLQALTLDEVDELVASLAFSDYDWISLVKNGVRLDSANFESPYGHIDLRPIYQAYQGGYTVSLAKVNRRHKPLALLCRDMELKFHAHHLMLVRDLSTHIYLTPPGCTGFAPHYDDHDVVVLQFHGVKHWKIYGTLEEQPIARQSKPITRDELPPLLMEVEARPGTVIYIPRGYYHEASAGDEASLHTTMSICPVTWLDLVLPLLRNQAGLRAPLPPLRPNDPSFALGVGRRLAQLMAAAVEESAVAERLRGVTKDAFDNLDPLPDAGFRNCVETDAIALSSVLRRASRASARIDVIGDEAKFIYAGSEFAAPQAARPVFDFLLKPDPFKVSEIPDVVDGETKVELARGLVRAGYLRVA
jgi:hypothetical protein